ncbi:hypothetical protein [Pelagibius sp.]|uniref:hypothetical protein n=1 Tax=Pelagibius sp. TaxID=1931238 RepID=UPI00260E4B25|nr:hypothetical protein [Pelagibius sp.]
MDHLRQEVSLTETVWDAQAVLDLSALKDDVGLDWYRGEVKAGRLAVYGAHLGRQRVGTVLLRYEQLDKGREMVIVAAAGYSRADLVALFLPRLETIARLYGCRSVRFHTVRAGLVRKAQRRGYAPVDIVLRKVVDGR